MAKGAQDWVARTDLLLQTLSELIVRYKYGAAQVLDSSLVTTTTGFKTLLNVSGKGIVYGGYVYAHKTGIDLSGDSLRITIDGTLVPGESFEILLLAGLDKPTGFKYLLQYDTVNGRFTVGIRGDITFESSLKIEYYSNTTLTIINTQILYATI